MGRMTLLCATASRFVKAAEQPAWSVRDACLRLAIGLTTLACLAVLAGCHNPAADRRIAQRQHNVRHSSQWLVDRENDSPRRLRRTCDQIGNEAAADERQLSRNLRDLHRYMQFDLNRWQDRQSDYGSEFERILRGKPENIEPALLMFF